MGIFGFLTRTPVQNATIHVEFINSADKSVFAKSDMPTQQLPDSFAVNTTLDIKGEKWSVVSAAPVSKSEFLKTGKLSLVLSKVVMMNPQELLYSLSTISDDIGAVTGDALPGADVFSIHEDDWRQVEFVDQKYEQKIAEELADIHNIRLNERQGTAFKKLHVRKRIPEPLTNCSLADVEAILPARKKYKGVGFVRTRGIVPQSFAWVVDGGLVIWGMTDSHGNVLRLCLSGSPEKDHITAVSEAFSKLTRQLGLFLVVWCRETQIDGDAHAFVKYFEGD